MTSYTVKASVTGGQGVSLRVEVLTGVVEAGGASANHAVTSSGNVPASISITPNTTGSFIGWVAEIANSATSGTAAASNNFLTVAAHGDNTADSGDGVSFYQGYYTGTVTGGIPLTAGTSAPSTTVIYEIAAYELEGAGWAEDPSTPALVTATGATSATTASFSPPPGAVLVALVANNFSGTGASTAVTVTSVPALTWTKRSAPTGTDDGMATVWTATVPGGAAGGAGPRPRRRNPRFRSHHLQAWSPRMSLLGVTSAEVDYTALGVDTLVSVLAGSPAVLADWTVTGGTSEINVTAGAGTTLADWTVTGATAMVDVTAGAGTVVSGQTVTGTTSDINVTAGAGTVTADWSIGGTTALINVTAAGSTAASMSGATALVDILAGAPAVLTDWKVGGATSVVEVTGAPGGISVTIPGTTAQVNVTASPGGITLTVPGATSLIDVTAPAGTPGVVTVVNGVTSLINIAAPAGSLEADWTVPGSPALISVTAPPGAVFSDWTITGAGAQIQVLSPSGSITIGGSPILGEVVQPNPNPGESQVVLVASDGQVVLPQFPPGAAQYAVASTSGTASLATPGPGEFTFSQPRVPGKIT